jgi:hypothetical protein
MHKYLAAFCRKRHDAGAGDKHVIALPGWGSAVLRYWGANALAKPSRLTATLGRVANMARANRRVPKGPFHQSTLFWGSLSAALAIILTVIAATMKDIRWLLGFAWPFTSLAVWEFSRTWGTPRQIKWITITGSTITAALMAALYIFLSPLALPVSLPTTSSPKVVLLSSPGQLKIVNNDSQTLELWGDKLEGYPASTTKISRLIPVGHYYYLLDTLFVSAMRAEIGDNGQKLKAFEVYLSDEHKNRWIARFYLLVIIKNGEIEIHTQQLGIVPGDWPLPS